MRFTGLLKRNIIISKVGSILNRSQGSQRRYTLFFEDILAKYFMVCESAGYPKEMNEVGNEWMKLIMSKHFRGVIAKLPVSVFFNVFMKDLWNSLGLMDDFRFTKKNDTVIIETRNEGVTRIIGENTGMVGFYAGILNVLFKSEAYATNVNQSKESCRYIYELRGECPAIKSKSKGQYNKLNYMADRKGIDLKNALEINVLRLSRENKLYFRDRFLCPIENTVFHVIGNKEIMLDTIPKFSNDYFNALVEKDTSAEKKLTLLKTLLQVMGWGVVTVIMGRDNALTVDIKNPPYGLQLEKDNWLFLSGTILGFLWLINPNFKIERINTGYKRVTMDYTVDGRGFS